MPWPVTPGSDMIRARVSQTSAILLAVGDLLGREIAIDELLARLVDRICAAMDADRGTIYLVDRAAREVFSKAARPNELGEIRLALGQGLAGWVAESGASVNVPTTTRDARFFAGVDERTGYSTRSILAVPMRDRAEEIIGVVQILNKCAGSFTLEDERLLARLAREAALAIEATSVYAELSSGERGSIEDRFNGIVGDSEPLRAACRITSKAAATNATVLIRGESGTGKGLFARALHVNSKRHDRPFVNVDCAALPASLIDNELFGHERGAYTGADARADGKVDAAAGGTLFLDEIGELPLEVQGKLLRLIQDREFHRVGGTETVKADVRVVAATNRDLERMIVEGRFRADLYYRIKVVELMLPPLRERGPKDIARLARHVVLKAARRHDRPIPRLSSSSMAALVAYSWPGNVRELENCLESAIIVMDGEELRAEHLPLRAARPSGSEELALEAVERRHIARVLELCDGHRARAAEVLGIGRNTLTRKLARYGLNPRAG